MIFRAKEEKNHERLHSRKHQKGAVENEEEWHTIPNTSKLMMNLPPEESQTKRARSPEETGHLLHTLNQDLLP